MSPQLVLTMPDVEIDRPESDRGEWLLPPLSWTPPRLGWPLPPQKTALQKRFSSAAKPAVDPAKPAVDLAWRRRCARKDSEAIVAWQKVETEHLQIRNAIWKKECVLGGVLVLPLMVLTKHQSMQCPGVTVIVAVTWRVHSILAPSSAPLAISNAFDHQHTF